MKEVAQYHALVDKFAAGISAPVKDKIPCCRGCSSCCYEPVHVLDLEMRHAVNGLDGKQRLAVKRRNEQVLSVLSQHPKLLDPKQTNTLGYRALRLPCPFLVDNACSIYERRPIGCRLHIAVGPKIQCDDDKLRATQQFIMPPDQSAILAKYRQECGVINFKPGLLPSILKLVLREY